MVKLCIIDMKTQQGNMCMCAAGNIYRRMQGCYFQYSNTVPNSVSPKFSHHTTWRRNCNFIKGWHAQLPIQNWIIALPCETFKSGHCKCCWRAFRSNEQGYHWSHEIAIAEHQVHVGHKDWKLQYQLSWWDKIEITRKCNSNYATDPKSRRSVSGDLI